MTRQRMEQLLDALNADDWELREGQDDLFTLVDDTIEWQIVNRRTGVELELQFRAFEPFGEAAKNLKDIFYCVALETGIRMSFEKITSPEWRTNLDQFVADLKSVAMRQGEG